MTTRDSCKAEIVARPASFVPAEQDYGLVPIEMAFETKN